MSLAFAYPRVLKRVGSPGLDRDLAPPPFSQAATFVLANSETAERSAPYLKSKEDSDYVFLPSMARVAKAPSRAGVCCGRRSYTGAVAKILSGAEIAGTRARSGK